MALQIGLVIFHHISVSAGAPKPCRGNTRRKVDFLQDQLTKRDFTVSCTLGGTAEPNSHHLSAAYG